MGILFLEHINLCVKEESQLDGVAGRFYVQELGCKVDPRLKWMLHVNIGSSQFHLLPADGVNRSQKVDGSIGLYYEDLKKLASLVKNYTWRKVDGFMESIQKLDDVLVVKGPYGNVFDCYQKPKTEKFLQQPGGVSLGWGMAYVKWKVNVGSVQCIVRFYEYYMNAKVKIWKDKIGVVYCGDGQYLIFEEVVECQVYDGHHICIYIDDFKATYERMQGLHWNNPIFKDKCDTWALVEQEQQFRFCRIIDTDTKDTVFTLEHEVRSTLHPRYLYPL